MRHACNYLTILIAVTAAGLAGGCGHGIDTPDGFVSVDQVGEFQTRAVSADGVVIGLRIQDNPDDGTLEFWSTAIENEITDRRGYELVDTEAVINEAGTPGTLMTFDAKRETLEMAYMLAVFVDGSDVLVAEAGGPADAFAPHKDAIRAALLTAR